jgi:hypothetical protein
LSLKDVGKGEKGINPPPPRAPLSTALGDFVHPKLL